MEVSVAVVTSLDGKMTRGQETDVHLWTSAEDQKRFHELRDSHDVLVMGSNTYELMRESMQHNTGRLRVILTSRPEHYASEEIPGQLEFHNKATLNLVDYLGSQGYQKLLVVGGGRMITDFLINKLVDKIYLTLEPRLFGEGGAIITQLADIKLRLLSFDKANEGGTLLLTYVVDKN